MTTCQTKTTPSCLWIVLAATVPLSRAWYDGGTTSCNESCDKTRDCRDGLACCRLDEGVKRCASGASSACFDQGKRCY